MYDQKQIRSGFTIVELLIVIVIIAILAAVTIVAYNGAKDRAQVSETNARMASVKKAMLLFKADYNELPPIGDSWNYFSSPPQCGTIESIMADLATKGSVNVPTRDSWGSCWGYDDNDCNAGATSATILRSIGPDKMNGTADDINLQITASCTN